MEQKQERGVVVGSLADDSIMEYVHEMFYLSDHSRARLPSVSYVEHESRVAHSIPAETSRSHPRVTQESFDFS